MSYPSYLALQRLSESFHTTNEKVHEVISHFTSKGKGEFTARHCALFEYRYKIEVISARVMGDILRVALSADIEVPIATSPNRMKRELEIVTRASFVPEALQLFNESDEVDKIGEYITTRFVLRSTDLPYRAYFCSKVSPVLYLVEFTLPIWARWEGDVG